MNHRRDNGRALASAALQRMDRALLEMIEAGYGQVTVEVRRMSDTHRRVLIHRTTPEEVVSLPAADLGGEVLARLGDREGRAAGPGPAQRRDGGVRRPPPCVAPPPSGAQDAHPCRDEQAAAAGVPHFGSRRYLDARQVARRYGISVPAVRKRLQRGQLPPPLAVGRRLLWDEADLDRFDDAHKARYAQRSRRTISS